MTYKMFIDDERFPPNDGEEWVICRNFGEATDTIRARGFPQFISFDHDLGYGMQSGYEIAQWIVSVDLSGRVSVDGQFKEVSLPDDFNFYVHSQNPVGAWNIKCLIDRYLKFKRTDE